MRSKDFEDFQHMRRKDVETKINFRRTVASPFDRIGQGYATFASIFIFSCDN